MSEYNDISQILSNWPPPQPVDPDTFKDPLTNRFATVLQSLEQTPKPGPLDLAVLIRHLLRRESLNRPEPNLSLRIPKAEFWPSIPQLESVGLRIHSEGQDSVLVTTDAWKPDWLNGEVLAEEVFRGEERRRDVRVIADDVVKNLVGYDQNLSPGQRGAVRAAFFLKAGHTLLVNLPTGAGKSLAFQAPALIQARQKRLTLIVVPTTSLALDHEHNLTKFTEDNLPLAYHGGLPIEQRKSFRDRIADGTQTIVITSPESAMGALRGSLLRSARKDKLAWFIVDEAHVLSDWGVEFRPEFQLLAGLRDGLLEASSREEYGLKTMLLSATISADTFTTLQHLFGKEPETETFHSVSAAHIRPEPEYWVHRAHHQQKLKCIEEAVLQLPRPLILYTTRRDDALGWYNRFRGLGFRRIALIRGGDLSGQSGRAKLKLWKERQTDVIVANSAFGLGVDQADVRSVVHACVPETIHRFYQEVGRGGRDGKPCVSLIIYNTEDESTGSSLGQNRVITPELGLKRWIAMWATKADIRNRDGYYTVSLKAQHPDITQDTPENIAWNKRTLILMARANIISLDVPPMPLLEQGEDEPDREFETRRSREIEETFEQVALKIEEPKHKDPEIWGRKGIIEKHRLLTRAADGEAIAGMRRLLRGREEFNQVFRKAYELNDPRVIPTAPKGYCPVTRSRGIQDSFYVPTTPVFDFKCTPEITGFLKRRNKHGEPLLVTYTYPPNRRSKRSILELMGKSVALGVCEIAVPKEWLDNRNLRELHDKGLHAFVIIRDISEPTPLNLNEQTTTHLELPRISLLGAEEASSPDTFNSVIQATAPFHMILLPSNTPDPDAHWRGFADTRDPTPLEALADEWAIA